MCYMEGRASTIFHHKIQENVLIHLELPGTIKTDDEGVHTYVYGRGIISF